MKIQKIALSILAIAISSSAFASTPSETNYAKITADAYARAAHSLRGESESTDSKNERTLILINSNSNTAYTYKLYSEQESKTVQDLSEKMSKLGLSDDVIYTTIKAQLDEFRKDSDVRNGIVKFANENKEKENARAISEFNALQEIALKEPDLAVKALIQQAADLKLASFAK